MTRHTPSPPGTLLAGAALVALAALSPVAEAHAEDTFKLGLVSFFSGGVSGPVGIPSRNGADLIIKAANEGTLPAPYSSDKGFAGAIIEPIYSDEAVPAADRVTEFRNLAERSEVDAVIGYASSGSCLAVAPVAEELQVLTILYYCGTVRIFEENDYSYVFRSMATADVENIGAARYIADTRPDLSSIAGINQNYAWGQDSWRDFHLSLAKLRDGVEIVDEQWPQLFAGQYGAEITALSRARADVVHSSLWGGDMEAFILQAAPRAFFQQQPVILTTGATAIYRLTDQIPEGTIIGARGPGGLFAPDTELNRWFRAEYEKTYGEVPTFPAYYMAQSVLALRAAAEKAGAGDAESIRQALVGIEFESPSGTITFARGNGHQAITDFALGTYRVVDGQPTVDNVIRYAAECVNPPAGMKSIEWIEAGFPGAKC